MIAWIWTGLMSTRSDSFFASISVSLILTCLQRLRSYIDMEYRNKKKKPFDFSGWEDWVYEVNFSIWSILTHHSNFFYPDRIPHSRKMATIVACLRANFLKPYHEETRHSISHKQICFMCGDVWFGKLGMSSYGTILDVGRLGRRCLIYIFAVIS